MAYSSLLTESKPVQHLSLADWTSRVSSMREIAEIRCKQAFELEQTARTLRNDTRIEANWSSYKTNELLTDRVMEVNHWREILIKVSERLRKEMEALRQEKVVTERELEALQLPIKITGECLAMRDSRTGSELTYDQANLELKNELRLLEGNQRMLMDQIQRGWEKLLRLEEVKFKIDLDISNKSNAVDIDVTQIGLDKISPTITNKPYPDRIPRNSFTYPGWLEHTQAIKQIAENELADTYSIREGMFVTREKARNILATQQQHVEHSLRKRIFETQRARNDLLWQKAKMDEAVDKARVEINHLEMSLREKIGILKLAETRLENRAQRVGVELCLDIVYDQLRQEVKNMKEMKRALVAQIDDTTTNYNLLLDQGEKINMDLKHKDHALSTDSRCLDIRQSLYEDQKKKASAVDAQYQYNLRLTKMEDKIRKD